MRASPTVIGKALIVLFCLWHMLSVAVYAVPREDTGDFALLSQQFLIPKVTPYLFITSQWQLWNLFSPEPLRRVTDYDIDIIKDNAWVTVRTISPKTFPVYKRAIWLKFLNNSLDEFSEHKEVRERFLEMQCKELELAVGTQIRLQYAYYIIPYDDSVFEHLALEPARSRVTGAMINCPALEP